MNIDQPRRDQAAPDIKLPGRSIDVSRRHKTDNAAIVNDERLIGNKGGRQNNSAIRQRKACG